MSTASTNLPTNDNSLANIITPPPFEILAYCDSICEPQNGRLGHGPMDVGYWAQIRIANQEHVMFLVHEVIRNEHGSVIGGTCNQAEYFGLLRLHAAVVKWLEESQLPLEAFLESRQATYSKRPLRNHIGHIVPWGESHRQQALRDYSTISSFREEIRERGVKLIINSDSQLMVRQLLGEWRVRAEDIKRLYDIANNLQNILPYQVRKLDRENNGIADALAQNRVLKHSAQSRQMEDRHYMVKQHTPCIEFLQGKGVHTLLKNQALILLRTKLTNAVRDRDEPAYIQDLLDQMMAQVNIIRDTIHINPKVRNWLMRVCDCLSTEITNFGTLLNSGDFSALEEDIREFFSSIAESTVPSAASEDYIDTVNVSVVNEGFFCPRTLNKTKQDPFANISELESMEGPDATRNRAEIYHDFFRDSRHFETNSVMTRSVDGDEENPHY